MRPGINVARVRYLALMIGGALMAVGGAFLTLAVLGSFTLDIIAGRGWVCIALVIFGRWRIWRGVAGRADLRRRLLAGPAAPDPPGFGERARRDHAGAALPRRSSRALAHLGPQRCLPGRLPEALPPDLSRRWTDARSDDRWTTATSCGIAIEQARIGPRRGRGAGRRRARRRRAACWASGHNRRVQQGSAIRHGETDCLENAGRLPASVYRRATMYTTLSPCDMCTGAILLYGIPRVVMGENETFLGGEDYLRVAGRGGRQPRLGRVQGSSCRVHRRATPRSGTRTSARSDAFSSYVERPPPFASEAVRG